MSTFSTYDSTVNSFYLAFYGRPADPAGLKFWSTQLAANNGDMGAIVNFFAASEEAQVRFGSDTTADRIAEIYSQLFNRAPDADGMAFWTNAIDQGHASLADVAISIFNGAQGSDATLSQLRQQAVDAFTAQVDASGSQYAGYASIEAARILVRAVTADASADDLAALVKAAVSFADTATKTPQVVEAIAVNTTLLALFDTARGVKEPVELAQALADTAKAAAGDPVTLEQLLRGGGMDKVLKVMPAKATLQDVVKALAEGGLPAAVEVVYPSAPVTPPKPVPTFGLDLTLKTVTHDKLDLVDDNVTNVKKVDVTFENKGRALSADQHIEYTLDGKTWIATGIDTSKPNTIVLQDIQLVPETSHVTSMSNSLMTTMADYQDTITKITLRAVDANGVKSAPFVQTIVYDGHAAMPVVALKKDTAGKDFGSDHDGVTSNPLLDVTGLEPGARVEYQLVNQPQKIVDAIVNLGNNTSELPWSDTLAIAEGDNTVRVRQIDAAGNISAYEEINFNFDMTPPPPVKVKLVADTGSSQEDNLTNSGLVKISGLLIDGKTAWEYSIDNGKSWTFGDENGDHSSAILDLGAGKAVDGLKQLVVRQVDLAGNTGKQSELLTFTLDTTAPTNALDFVSVSGAKEPGSKTTTLEEADVVFSYAGQLEVGSTVEFRIGDDEWSPLPSSSFGDGKITVPVTDLKGGDPTVAVRIVDQAGNAGQAADVVIDGPAIEGTLEVSGALGMDSLNILSSISGQLYLTANGQDTALTINGLPGMVTKDMPTMVGVQEKAVSGVLKVMNASTTLTEPTGATITLGTKSDDYALKGSFVLGFGGDDELIGTDSFDYLDGGTGNDYVYGGKGGDGIFVTGNDTLIYKSGADSNFSSLLNTSGSSNSQEMQTSDFVFVMPGSKATFDLQNMQIVSGAINAKSTAPNPTPSSSFFVDLTAAYNKEATSDYDAVLFQTSGSTGLLVVNNGDDVIDSNDLIVTIVGLGGITLDGNGNIVYGPMID